MSLYVDTSCFLKIFIPEPESCRVARLVSFEAEVFVSPLTWVESLTQFAGFYKTGRISRAVLRSLEQRVDAVLKLDPFRYTPLPASLFDIALRQIQSQPKAHCRTLDRLHLAAMEALGATRLLTNDDQQAAAAKRLDYEVILPR